MDSGHIYAAAYNDTGTEWSADRYKIFDLGVAQANTVYRVVMIFDATSSPGVVKASLNGGTFLELQEVQPQAAHSGAIGIGAEQGGTVRPSTLALTNNSNTNLFTGTIGQILLWNHALTDNEFSAVDAYLTYRWTRDPAIQINTGDTINEGGTSSITSSKLYTVDSNTTPSNLMYQILGFTNGEVRKSGVGLTVGGTFTQADIDSGLITFVHDSSDTVSAYFDYRVTDGTAVDTDRFNLTIIPVDDAGNDPPTISINNTSTVTYNSFVTMSNTNLLVSDVDTAASSLTFNVTSTLNGYVYKTTTGTTVTTFTQADINAGIIRFYQNGTVNGFANFGFTVNDGTTTVSGTKTFTVSFPDTGANDPPVITVNTGSSVNTGGTVSLSNTKLKATDPDNSITQLIYTITSVLNGTVKKNGTALSVGQTFTQADLNFGIISYTHNGSATTTGGFNFNLTDGTTNVTGNNYAITVVVNNPPSLAGSPPGPFSVAENTANGTLIMTASAFDTEGNAITYSIQSGNALGVFQINPLNGQVTIADNTNLDYESVTSFNLVIRVTDSGIGNPYSEYTITVNVTNVDEAPVVTNNGLTLLEGATATIGTASLTAADVDTAAGSIIYTVTGSPANGRLELSTAPGVAITSFTQAQIAANQVRYVHFGGENTTDSFTFTVKDATTTLAAATFNITVTPVDDAPVLNTNATLSLYEGATATIGTAYLSSSDVDTAAGSIIYTVTGSLFLAAGASAPGAVSAAQVISAADIAYLRYTPPANVNGAAYASFTFQVRDDGGTANGGADTDSTPNTITINVTSVNDAPTGTDKTVTILEDAAYTFAASDFGFGDATDSPANALFSVYIDTLPAAGTLTLGGVAVTAGQEIPVASIGTLVFTPAANANGTGYANFTFRVRDNGGTANGGVDTDGSANTITIDVISVNDAPAGTDKTLTMTEGGTYSLSAADFGFSDPNDSPVNNFSAVVINAVPALGTLFLAAGASAPVR